MIKSFKRTVKLTIIICFYSLNSFATEDSIDTASKPGDYKWDRFSLNAGGFISALNSDMQILSEGLGLGVIVNLEDALGLESSASVFRIESEYTFGKRQNKSIRASYFNFKRSSSKVIESELNIGDVTFPIGTQIQSTFNLRIIKALYNYSFYKDERVKLGLSSGLFVMPIQFKAKISDNKGEVARFIAPLPVVGLDAVFTINPKLRLKQSFEVLYLSVANFKGSISDINLKLEYDPWDHFGFGIGLNAYKLNITSFKENSDFFQFKGTVAMNYTGVSLYARYFF